MRSASQSRWHIASRVCAGVFGSYVFTCGFIALGAACLLSAHLEFHEATSLVSMLGFIVFLAALCFAFIARSLVRVWSLLAGGGAVMLSAGWWLSRSLA